MYTWDYGDLNSGYGQSATNFYTTNGTYTVCLTVMDSTNTLGACTYTICDTVTISGIIPSAQCHAQYSIFPDSNNAYPHTYLGYNLSTGTNLTYTWIWGDGTTSTGFAPSHTYAAAGNYVLCLAVKNNLCADTMCATQGIYKKLNDPYSINIIASALAINTIEKNNVLEVYPNPTNEKLFFKLDDNKNWMVTIFDVFGKTILSQNIKNEESVNVANLKNGIYIATAKNENGKTIHCKFNVVR